MHDERFASTRRHPVGKLVELRPGFSCCVERREAVGRLFAGVVFLDPGIDRSHQIARPIEIPVEIDFREQEGEILKVFPDDRVFAAEKAGFVQPLGVADDVLVVVEQLRGGEPCAKRGAVENDRLVELVDVVGIESLEVRGSQVVGELIEPLGTEQRQHPLGKNELLRERHHGRGPLRGPLGPFCPRGDGLRGRGSLGTAGRRRGGRLGGRNRRYSRASAGHQATPRALCFTC